MKQTSECPQTDLNAGESCELHTLTSHGFSDYELLDSGNGRKLERFGTVVVDRPEPQALWQPLLGEKHWNKAHAYYSARDNEDTTKPGGKGQWKLNKPIPESWPIKIENITMTCKLQGPLAFWDFSRTGAAFGMDQRTARPNTPLHN